VDMEDLARLILSLPNDLQSTIYEYNVEHRKKFYWSLKDIENSQWCQVCDNIIKKYVFSYRRGDEVCCSNECLDNFGSIAEFDRNGGRWIYTGEDYQYIPPRSHYEHTNY